MSTTLRRAPLPMLARPGVQLYVGTFPGRLRGHSPGRQGAGPQPGRVPPLRYRVVRMPPRCAALTTTARALGFLLSVPKAAAAAARGSLVPREAPGGPVTGRAARQAEDGMCGHHSQPQAGLWLGYTHFLGTLGRPLAFGALTLASLRTLSYPRSRLDALSSFLLLAPGRCGSLLRHGVPAPPRAPAPSQVPQASGQVFYLVSKPVLNPCFCSLRNREVCASPSLPGYRGRDQPHPG